MSTTDPAPSTPAVDPPDPTPSTPAVDPPGPVVGAPLPTGHSRRRRILVAGLVTTVLAAGTAVWLTTTAVPAVPQVSARHAPVALVAPLHARTPVARLVGSHSGLLAWESRLSVQTAYGQLRAVRATGPQAQDVPGTRTSATTWRSTGTLVPGERYDVAVEVVDAAGRASTLSLAARTTTARKHLQARVSPGDGALVGVGTPVIVSFDRPLRTASARAAVQQRLSVSASPPVRGAWHWVGTREVHYRGPHFWAAGSRVSVRADLDRLPLPGGVWGQGVRTTSYRVGDAVVSTVDVTQHRVTVRRNGRVIRVMRASMGRPGYDTRGGTHIVLEKQAERIMDSSTVGHPKGTPDYYRELVKDTVRITNSGTFTHSAPWSVGDQGVRNVSHGCINLSPADGHWFFSLARRGDVVEVVHAVERPSSWDAGTVDWNSGFADWARGGALS